MPEEVAVAKRAPSCARVEVALSAEGNTSVSFRSELKKIRQGRRGRGESAGNRSNEHLASSGDDDDEDDDDDDDDDDEEVDGRSAPSRKSRSQRGESSSDENDDEMDNENENDNDGALADPLAPGSDAPVVPGLAQIRPRNTFMDTIARIERRVTMFAAAGRDDMDWENPESGSENDDEDGDGEDDKGKKRKKGGGRRVGEYDRDDGFIDDSEYIDYISSRHGVKTAHEGFYVNQGELQVFEREKTRRSGGTVSVTDGKRAPLPRSVEELDDDVRNALEDLVKAAAEAPKNSRSIPTELDKHIYNLNKKCRAKYRRIIPVVWDEVDKHIAYTRASIRKRIRDVSGTQRDTSGTQRDVDKAMRTNGAIYRVRQGLRKIFSDGVDEKLVQQSRDMPLAEEFDFLCSSSPFPPDRLRDMILKDARICRAFLATFMSLVDEKEHASGEKVDVKGTNEDAALIKSESYFQRLLDVFPAALDIGSHVENILEFARGEAASRKRKKGADESTPKAKRGGGKRAKPAQKSTSHHKKDAALDEDTDAFVDDDSIPSGIDFPVLEDLNPLLDFGPAWTRPVDHASPVSSPKRRRVKRDEKTPTAPKK